MWKTPTPVEPDMFAFRVFAAGTHCVAVLDVEGVSYTVGFGHGIISSSSLSGGPGHPGSVGVAHTQDIDGSPRGRYTETSWNGPLHMQQYGRGKRI